MTTDRTNAERQRRYIERLKAKAAAVSNDDEIAALREELAAAKAAAVSNAAAMAALRRAKPTDEAHDRRIKALTTEVRNLKAELHAVRADRNAAIARAGGMTNGTRIMIAKVLHTDYRPSQEERLAAMQAFNAWVDSNGKAKKR